MPSRGPAAGSHRTLHSLTCRTLPPVDLRARKPQILRPAKLIRRHNAVDLRVMDQIYFGLFRMGRHAEGLSNPIFERPFYLARSVDVVVSVPVNGLYFGKVLL